MKDSRELFSNNIELKNLHTFSCDVKASQFATFSSSDELIPIFDAIEEQKLKWLVIGGGSNLLFTKDFDGVILKSSNIELEVVSETSSEVLVRCGAAVVWDDLCLWCCNNGFYGVENLAAIPGSVGASPVQNVGAYGSEAKDAIYLVEYFDIESRTVKSLKNSECNFGYRDSVFKRELKGKSVVLAVTYCFSKVKSFNIEYGNLKEMVLKGGEPTLTTVREAVIATRAQKLPDTSKIGNGGSFFKNPLVEAALFEELFATYPSMPHFKVGAQFKIPAAWLIDMCGWKGYRSNSVGVYQHQPLVLVNFGGANGGEVLELSNKIIESVREKFSITLEPEINIL